ncbi:MAG: hypothetical protein J1E57_10000 [Prevotella sp.]|nr:hypothetical protein [Prevotella sp.]
MINVSQIFIFTYSYRIKTLFSWLLLKGHPNPWSDIDVAVIVPTVSDYKWLETSIALGKDSDKVNILIEPVLMAEDHWSPLYDDVMQTGISA